MISAAPTSTHNLAICDEPSAAAIWGAPVLKQPFQRVDFREIRIPGWVEETLGVGYTLSVQNADQRQRAVAAGVTISELGFVDPLYVYYDSKWLKRRSPHVARDAVDKEVAEYRRLGLRILAVYPPTLQGEVYAEHPDWRRISSNSTEIPQVDLAVHPHGGMLCLLGPYGDFFIEVLAEIVEKYHVDAFSFDGLHYGGVCYCQNCRMKFRQEMQSDIPDVNLNDPAFRRYQHWADRRMEDLVRRMQIRLKGIQPHCALITWTTNAGRFGHFRDIPRNMPARMNLLLDAPDQEFWMDETNRGATIVPALSNAYIWACTNHRVAFSEPYLMSRGNPYGKDSFPAHEVQRRVLQTLTHGAIPSLAVLQPNSLQGATDAALAEVQRRKPWLTRKKPEPWCGLVLSDNSRTFYGRDPGKVEDRYLAHVFGAYRAVLESHLPATVLCDWHLTKEQLTAYKVLVLPDTACLSDDQVASIRDFVFQGGGLVASLDTSLCNEYGDLRPDFALADAFGVQYVGPAKQQTVDRTAVDSNVARGLDETYWQKRKNVFDLKLQPDQNDLTNEKLISLLGCDPVTFKGPSLITTLDGATPSAFITAKDQPQETSVPAIVTHKFGQGRVVYFAAGIDHAYYSYAYPYQRLLLENAIRWAAGPNLPPLEVQAPLCVQSTIFRQQIPAGSRLLVHLFNDVNTTAHHGLPGEEVPLREETLPIHDIRLQLRGYDLTKARQQPENKALPIHRNGDSITITVPRLDVHSVVVLE